MHERIQNWVSLFTQVKRIFHRQIRPRGSAHGLLTILGIDNSNKQYLNFLIPLYIRIKNKHLHILNCSLYVVTIIKINESNIFTLYFKLLFVCFQNGKI